jgi:hypothetical protein
MIRRSEDSSEKGRRMTTTNVTAWLMRGYATASIIFNDPVWAEQHYEMDRGERRRGDYDPPIPGPSSPDLIGEHP